MTTTIPAPADNLLVDDSAVTDRVIADSRQARTALLAAMAGTRAARCDGGMWCRCPQTTPCPTAGPVTR